MSLDLERSISELRDGRVTFEDFVQDTQPVMQGMARKIIRQWKAPNFMAPEDVAQEAFLAAWQRVWTFDENRGTELRRYVMWNAKDRATKHVHKARLGSRPHRGECNMRSVQEVPSTPHLQDEDLPEGERRMRLPHEEPRQEEGLERRDAIRRALAACGRGRKGAVERAVVLAVAEKGSIAPAAHALYRDRAERRRLGLRSLAHAEEVTLAALERVAARLG